MSCPRNGVCAALLLALAVAAGCSSLAISGEDAPASGPDPAYNVKVANRIKNWFKDHASYEAFEISDYRWVHSITGWNWLTCVRFQERGHRRTYAVFLKGNEIVDSRYAVQADGCDTAGYTPFDLATGAATARPNPGEPARPASARELDPLH